MGTGIHNEFIREKLAMAKFKPGQSGNPKGPGKGYRRRLSERFWKDLHADWDVYGKHALAETRANDPVAYCKMVAGLMPSKQDIEVKQSVFVDVWQRISDNRVPGDVLDVSHETVDDIRALEHNPDQAVNAAAFQPAERTAETVESDVSEPVRSSRGMSPHDYLIDEVRARRRREMLEE